LQFQFDPFQIHKWCSGGRQATDSRPHPPMSVTWDLWLVTSRNSGARLDVTPAKLRCNADHKRARLQITIVLRLTSSVAGAMFFNALNHRKDSRATFARRLRKIFWKLFQRGRRKRPAHVVFRVLVDSYMLSRSESDYFFERRTQLAHAKLIRWHKGKTALGKNLSSKKSRAINLQKRRDAFATKRAQNNLKSGMNRKSHEKRRD
jgi:hypothetical protein